MIQFDVGIKMQIIINVYVLPKKHASFPQGIIIFICNLIPPYNISTKLYRSSKNILQISNNQFLFVNKIIF